LPNTSHIRRPQPPGGASIAARLVAEGGEIKLLRESLNVVAAAQALFPGGVADLPRPFDEIYLFKLGYQS
jgi:hypothetical protein